ncbi:cathepsin L precursor-like [Scleropages formosus]|uniref:Cathepsin L-like n=1 Tax=Scleropages formosus TaxID=113540 RepID=A0A0P7TWB3_SCLFO|nr:cathepsin L precursor-like [Scleropages formosus]
MKMRLLMVMAALVAAALSASVSLEDLEFHAWKLKFGKSYRSPAEEEQRRLTWLSNRKRVLIHNMLADQGIKTYRLGMTFFADMDNKEYRRVAFRSCLGFFNTTKARRGSTYLTQTGVTGLPATVDWRDKGYTGSLEGQNFRKTNKLVSLSEQQLVDCSGDFGNFGCGGGLMDQAFEYIKANGGIDTEDSYPYEAEDGTCRFKPENVGATCSGYVDIPSGDENALKEAVATVGPVSVAIDAGHESFQLYQSGSATVCRRFGPAAERQRKTTTLRTYAAHLPSQLGYGTENGQDYWLVKNSWGLDWGDQGYIKMSRNKKNQCGIATASSYPLV